MQYIFYSFECKCCMCSELCAISYCDLKLPYIGLDSFQFGAMHIVADTKMLDAIYYGLVCTWDLTLRVIPSERQRNSAYSIMKSFTED